MKAFNVLTLGGELSEKELDLVIASFAELYHRVTFKHHRRIRIKVVCEIEQAEYVLSLARNYKVGSNVDMISHHDFYENDWAGHDISVLFLPTQKRVGKITRNALSQSIPIVSFQNESISEYVDQSCGMLIRKRETAQNKDAFSRILSMLYFDPEVRKLLKKGAAKKYREISGFRSEHQERRRVTERTYRHSRGY